MNQEEKNKTFPVRKVLLIAVVLLLVAGGVFAGMHWQEWFGDKEKNVANLDSGAQDWVGKKEKKQEEAAAGIAIPGFKSMKFVAGETTQEVNFYNPSENDCYFVLTLLLPDGTQLWKSEMLEPGKGFYFITLEQPMEAGSYPDSVLKYECFKRNEELTPLNGSEMLFELIVE